jgi:hypothetical protein
MTRPPLIVDSARQRIPHPRKSTDDNCLFSGHGRSRELVGTWIERTQIRQRESADRSELQL